MIHHTILDPSVIFGQDYKLPELVECKYLGQDVEAFKGSDDTLVISRIISTDPNVYLDPKLQPGCKFSLSSINGNN